MRGRSAGFRSYKRCPTQSFTEERAAGNRPGSVPPPAPCPAGRRPCRRPARRRSSTSSPAFTLPVRSEVTPTTSDTFVAINRGEHDCAALQLVLQLVHRFAQRLGIRAIEGRREHLRALHVHRLVGEIVALARGELRLEPRELLLQLPSRCRRSAAIFCATSCAGVLSAGRGIRRAAPAAAGRTQSAPSAVTASTRRMPAATPVSETILKKPMSPVRSTCVPPQSSRGELAHADHAHLVAVLLAEERHRADS